MRFFVLSLMSIICCAECVTVVYVESHSPPPTSEIASPTSGNYASRERAIIAKATRRFHLLVVPLFLCYFPLMMAIVSKAVRASGCPAPWIFVLENAMIPLQGFFVSLVYSYNANLRWEIMARCWCAPWFVLCNFSFFLLCL